MAIEDSVSGGRPGSGACPHLVRRRDRVDVPQQAYVARDDGTLLARYAPIFVLQTYADSYNRIGTPSARLVGGKEEVYVDPNRPVIYAEHREFRTARGAYTNLIYRVHFERIPFPALTTGRNVGIFVIVTLDQQQRPVLVTTLHTCGCYLVFIPTCFLPQDALPHGWNAGGQNRWGEQLPGMLQLPASSARAPPRRLPARPHAPRHGRPHAEHRRGRLALRRGPDGHHAARLAGAAAARRGA